ncbi:MAG: SDR family NAD(P)-dependent oxidoreductase [Bacilli bacterium]|nr:SDR family NAD(P)-dependent oxidoreductase [Bacilli bacterium]MBN2696332.1 SDR family NAD(P)-dependent oxidoreductase [Bacilli bacterium]
MDKIAVITGASSGIGLAIAKLLHEKGYRVIGISRSFPKALHEFEYVLCDLANPEQVEAAGKTVFTLVDHVDLLVNCAGMGIGGAIEETTIEEYNQIFDVNVRGTFLLTKALLPLLRDVKRAKIINIGSVAGALILPFQAFYSMTKAAIAAFSEALRNELRPFGIAVTTILPGDTKTNFTYNRVKSDASENSMYKARQERSLKKMEADETNGASPDSVARIVYKLAQRRTLPVQYTVGIIYKLFMSLNKVLPKRLVNWILYRMYGK